MGIQIIKGCLGFIKNKKMSDFLKIDTAFLNWKLIIYVVVISVFTLSKVYGLYLSKRRKLFKLNDIISDR